MTLRPKNTSEYQVLYKSSQKIADLNKHKIEIGNIYFNRSITVRDNIFPESIIMVYDIYKNWISYYSNINRKEYDLLVTDLDLVNVLDVVFERWLIRNNDYIKFAKLNLITI